MTNQRKIEILTEQKKKIKSSNWSYQIWYAETTSILELIFIKHEVKKKQLSYIFKRPGYNILGINLETASRECDELLDGFINELKIQSEIEIPHATVNGNYISQQRINELSSIKSELFDLSKLIALCNEININYSKKNFYSIAILIRVIMDHVPPIFGKRTFNEVANNISSKSLKKNFINLQNSMRNIADGFLHKGIRNREVLPSETQVDFKADLDTLLSEVIRLMK
ncbi:hypothetical protein [Confluentibacter sediminis]|uniref:hypothetical protein n=1 Tax=Confluentibacter sediminis TaxID=2219045 RepID=UPI000DAC929C|nr:hypothetical protein [Confluentibacter sediminis]